MHLSRLPALLLLAAATAGAQSRSVSSTSAAGIPTPRPFQHGESIVMGFDEASGYGTVDLQPMPVDGATDLRLQALFKFKGRALAVPPAQVSLALHSLAPAARHAATKAVRLAPDGGAPVVLPVLFRQVDTTGGRVRETLALSAPRAALLRLAAAKRVDGRAGDATFALGPAQLEALRDFASRMAPAAHRAALAAASGAAPSGAPAARPRRPGVRAATEVERRAQQRGGLVPPRYPVVPLAERQPRRVAVEFVVDTAGRVDTTSVEALSVGDSLFARAVRKVAGDWAFTPAAVGGRPVAQLVTQAIPFDPGTPPPPPLELPAGACTAEALASFGGAVYTEDQFVGPGPNVAAEGMDQIVIPAETNRSPAMPQGASGGGTVLAQFVVDATGAVVPCTVRILESSAPAFGDAVREAILGWRFEPATIRGVPVAQLVERGFRFAR